MNAAFARIALRYLVGYIAAKGFVSSDMAASLAVDPDVLGMIEAGLTVAFGAAVEGWYYLAKRFGWSV